MRLPQLCELLWPNRSSSRCIVCRPSGRKAPRHPSQLLRMTRSAGNSLSRRCRIWVLTSGRRVWVMWKFPQQMVLQPVCSGSMKLHPHLSSSCRAACCWIRSRRVGQGSCQTKFFPVGEGQGPAAAPPRPAAARWAGSQNLPAPAAARCSWGRRCRCAGRRAFAAGR